MEIMVLELPEVDVTDCANHNQCRNRCINEVRSKKYEDEGLTYEVTEYYKKVET